LIIGLDHKGCVSGSRLILLRLALDETTHVGDVILGDIPLAKDLISDSGKVVIGIDRRDFGLERTGADLQRLSPYSPVGVGIFVAVVHVAQVVDVRVEVPVTSDVVKGVIFQGEVDDVLDLEWFVSRLVAQLKGDVVNTERSLTFSRSWLQVRVLRAAGRAAAAEMRPARAAMVQADFMMLERYFSSQLTVCGKLEALE
jgi:hypothetical protein